MCFMDLCKAFDIEVSKLGNAEEINTINIG